MKALGDVDVSAIQKSTSSEKSSSKALFKLNIAANGESHEIVVLSVCSLVQLRRIELMILSTQINFGLLRVTILLDYRKVFLDNTV